MGGPDSGKRPVLGLRERKKVKTRATIQKQAMRLFRKQGYGETTVEQIAAAVEISPSTFFRYFPAKEDVVTYDVLDPLILEKFKTQPMEFGPIKAIRETIKAVFGDFSADELKELQEREKLMRTVPELRSKALEEVVRSLGMFTKVLAKRVGCTPEELSVRTTAGAVLGVILSIWLTSPQDNTADFFKVLDRALEKLEVGLMI